MPKEAAPQTGTLPGSSRARRAASRKRLRIPNGEDVFESQTAWGPASRLRRTRSGSNLRRGRRAIRNARDGRRALAKPSPRVSVRSAYHSAVASARRLLCRSSETVEATGGWIASLRQVWPARSSRTSCHRMRRTDQHPRSKKRQSLASRREPLSTLAALALGLEPIERIGQQGPRSVRPGGVAPGVLPAAERHRRRF